jgi:hypothetical protein
MSYQKETFILKTMEVYKGTIADGGEDHDTFSGSIFGWTRQGDTTIEIPMEWAEAIGNTPGVTIRKDPTRKQYRASFSNFQFDREKINLIINGEVTSESGTTYIDFGDDEDAREEAAWAFQTDNVSDQTIQLVFRKGIVTPDDAGLTASGTEHAVLPYMIEFFPDEDLSDRNTRVGWYAFPDALASSSVF